MKKLFLVVSFLLISVLYADEWKFINETNYVQTTMGYTQSGKFQYICDWIQTKERNVLTLHIRSNKSLYFGRYKSSCVIIDDFVFPSDTFEGFGDDSIFLSFKQKRFIGIVNDGQKHDVIVKVAGYLFYTEINSTYGEFKD